MFRSRKSICYGIALFILLSMSSCSRPLFVSSCCSEKGRASLKKKGSGGRINNRDSDKFERFKGKDKDEFLPSDEKKDPRKRAKF
jgi:hypothetical protein